MKSLSVVLVLTVLMAVPLHAEDVLPGTKQVTVFFEKDRFAGWPANNGIWNWGDEIVVGFTLGWYKNSGGGHPIDRDRPSAPRLARSLDGGETWVIETPSYLDENGNEKEAIESPGGIDFTHPDFALLLRMAGSNEGYSRFYFSYDRCKNWQGPYALPTFDRKGIFARNDYIVNGKDDCLIFITAAEDVGGEGWPLCARTTDGGKTWQFQGWIGKQPAQHGYSIMPSTVRVDENSLLSIIRRRSDVDNPTTWWIEAYLSPDNGHKWYMLDQPYVNNAGNPASMITLKDGRIALTYGYRLPAYGVRAMISADKGQTWSPEVVLRGDGGEWDLGYPRTAQRADGKCVT
ncbi:MAG: exo-alpha-sialidase, partial [Candidatus Hydrogenedentes bacterium]|nr:exo-alpha-sialidase [Candidatus Hydrogenedentota bacterium]